VEQGCSHHIGLAILTVPFVLYFVFYVTSQRDYFVDRSHRSLAGMSRQVVSRVEGLRSIVQKRVEEDEKPCPASKPENNRPGSEKKDPDNSLAAYFNSLRPFGLQVTYQGSQEKPGGRRPLIGAK
jgi:hypothetical protein